MGTIQIDGSTPKLTIGNATAEDALILFDGAAQDFYIGLDDSADDLIIGLGSAVGTTPAISINEDRDVTISDGAIDFDVASHDTSNGLKLGGTLVTATAAELNIMDGVTATAAEINLIDGGTARGTTALADGDGILINDAGTMRMTNVTTVKTYMGLAVGDITGATALAEQPASDDEIVINDGGALKRLDISHISNTPLFSAYNNAAHSISTATATELIFNTENVDSDGKFASNRFTPTIAGKYLIHASIVIENLDDGEQCRISLRKNGSQITGPYPQIEMFSGKTNGVVYAQVTQIITLDADDYVSAFGYHDEGASQNSLASINKFIGFRLTGVTS